MQTLDFEKCIYSLTIRIYLAITIGYTSRFIIIII